MAKIKTYTHCQQCGKPKKIPTTKYIPREAYERDPYCSRACAELARGIKPEEER